MSLIDRAMQGHTAEASPLTVTEAIASVLVAAIASDGQLTPDEAFQMNSLLSTSRLLRTAGVSPQATVERAIGLLNEHGIEAVLNTCAGAIPAELRPTTFALAMDLVLADGRIGPREKTFIDELQGVLGIDDTLALKIVEVALIRNRPAGSPAV
jgi:uncharacterized tellurite resistance protein B-like protein